MEVDQPKKKAPQPGSSKQAPPASAKKAATTSSSYVDSQTGGRVTLAPQKYSPSTLAQQLSSSGNSDRDSSNNAVKSILKDQNFSLNISSQFGNLPSYGK